MAFSWIELDGVLNMRDLAGTRLAGGDRIAPHRLVRSDNLNFLTDHDVAVLIEQIPEEWSVAALILGALVGAANVYVARFTEPAVTQMQQDRILREVDRVEAAEAVAAAPAALPVYRGESTQSDGAGAYAD